MLASWPASSGYNVSRWPIGTLANFVILRIIRLAMSNDAPTAAAVVPIRGRMTDAEYAQARAKLRALYGDSSIEAAAKRDQALAVLFYHSGWTQDELAKKENKSQDWISLHMRFGRFLNFTTMVVKSESLPKNLTERRFRFYWDQTKNEGGNERARFRAVHALIDNEPIHKSKRPLIGDKIKNDFADGKWHRLSTIAQHVESDIDHVEATLTKMMGSQTYGCTAEKKTVGTHLEFRIFKLDKTVSSSELREKLEPLIAGLEVEGRKNAATMSVVTVAYLAKQLRTLLDQWTE